MCKPLRNGRILNFQLVCGISSLSTSVINAEEVGASPTTPTNNINNNMGKYKNDFSVVGTPSLLGAFVQELEQLGYKVSTCDYRSVHSDNKTEQCLTVYGSNGNDRDDSTYVFVGTAYRHNSHYHLQQAYQLPQLWDKALGLASELKKIVFEPKIGDWVTLSLDLCDSSNYQHARRYTEKIENKTFKVVSTGSLTHIKSGKPIKSVRPTSFGTSYPIDIARSATEKEIIAAIFSKLPFEREYKTPFIAVRTLKEDEYDAKPSCSKETASVGDQIKYYPKEDALVTYGYNGRFLLYENGVYAQKRSELPSINRYTGELYEFGVVKYGCASFHFDFFRKLEKVCNEVDTNREITSVTLDSGVTITMDQIKEVLKVLPKQEPVDVESF